MNIPDPGIPGRGQRPRLGFPLGDLQGPQGGQELPNSPRWQGALLALSSSCSGCDVAGTHLLPAFPPFHLPTHPRGQLCSRNADFPRVGGISLLLGAAGLPLRGRNRRRTALAGRGWARGSVQQSALLGSQSFSTITWGREGCPRAPPAPHICSPSARASRKAPEAFPSLWGQARDHSFSSQPSLDRK